MQHLQYLNEKNGYCVKNQAFSVFFAGLRAQRSSAKLCGQELELRLEAQSQEGY